MAALRSVSEDVVYLDHNSTTPLLPSVLEAMEPFWTSTFANPASAHRLGQRARQALGSARETVAAILDAHPEEVTFTSGATEANNLALLGLAGSSPGPLVCSSIEHPSITEPLAQLQRRGFKMATLPVDSFGVVCPSSLPPLLAGSPRVVTVMLANNETGAIQPVAELMHIIQQTPMTTEQPFFHCDAVQAVGKIPVSFRKLGVTSLSLSAHKFNGPRGIGALLVRSGTMLTPLFFGGHQQHGRRPGTEPVVLAIGLAKALEVAHQELSLRTRMVRQLRQRFLVQLRELALPMVLNGQEEGGLPNTLNLSFPGCDAATLLMKLDLGGVACSTGSACSSGSLLPSPVLQAMKSPPEVLNSAIRLSLSHLHSESEIDTAVSRIVKAVRQLRQGSL